MLDPRDTIAAIASPPGIGSRALIRLSGAEALAIACRSFRPDPADGEAAAGPRLRSGHLAIGGVRPPVPARIACWPGPRTYTGESMAEVHLPGSAPIAERFLADCLEGGARLAEPGEFTLRAFLAGRIDLTAAEAVLGVIEAEDPKDLQAALEQLAGGIARPIRQLRDRVADRLAHLEALLDFAEEPDVDDLDRAGLAAELAEDAEGLRGLSDRLAERDRPGRHPRVVLHGPPNSGKSRLFNALLGRPAAIVSDVPGTTRDYLCEPADCGGLVVDLVDTAGEEDPDSSIEARAQEQRGEQSRRADLILDCLGPGTELLSNREDGGIPRLLLWTKSDLGGIPGPGRLAVSSRTGDGLDRLRVAIADALRGRSVGGGGGSVRCRDSLLCAAASLREAAGCLAIGLSDEVAAAELRQVLDELGRVVGTIVTDDLLDRIFRKFCIGK